MIANEYDCYFCMILIDFPHVSEYNDILFCIIKHRRNFSSLIEFPIRFQSEFVNIYHAQIQHTNNNAAQSTDTHQIKHWQTCNKQAV